MGHLSAERRALMERMLAERGVAKPPGIPRADAGPVRASSGQERLWVLEELAPAEGAYHLCQAARLCGRLGAAEIAALLERLVDRHEALRTTFELRGDVLYQRVHDRIPLALEVEDAAALAEPERSARVTELVRAAARLPFDLERGPLLRATLVRTGEREHVLALVMHHIVSDGWSTGVMLRDLAVLVAGGRLDPPALRYADWASSERRRLEAGELDAAVEHFRAMLATAPPSFELPPDRARPPVETHRGARVGFELDAALVDRLTAVARRAEATLFMTLLAGFEALLVRLTRRTDVVVGTPVAGREHAELEPLVGFFVNTLALRTDLAGRPSFLEALRRVRATALGAFANQAAPFERVVAAVDPPRDPSRPALFQILFVLQSAPAGPLEMGGVRVEPIEIDTGTAQFDLTLEATARPGGALGMSFIYNTDLYAPRTIALLRDQLVAVLEAASRRPELGIDALAAPGAGEHALLARFNDTARRWPDERPVHELVLEQALRAPHAPALRFEGRRVSYGALSAAAGSIAATLRGRGVRRGSIVGVCVERSPELVATVIATLAAGAAYLPLDPGYPHERLGWMARDARVALVVCDEAGAAALAGLEGVALMRVAPLAGDRGPSCPSVPVSPAELAYVIYTSGSTGTPKGVACTHGGLANRLAWMQDSYGIGPGDRVLHKTPASFDVSVWELLWPLMTGAEMVIARAGGHQDAAYLVALVAAERPRLAHFVPSMLRAFLEEPDLEACRCLERILCSGEVLPPELALRARERLGCAVDNLYGPTEAAIDVTAARSVPEPGARTIPIGAPIANVRMHVLDDALAPLPIGGVGELYIAGVQLARGYLGRPELTAERFVPDPFGPPGARLYRTGDLGRWRHDGALEYLGRVDHQVKLRGYRIELGEIEAALEACPGVREAAVVVRDDGSGCRLVAFVTATAAGVFAADEARARLAARLPPYMVPAAYLTLDAMPRSPSGKLDRRALPASGAATGTRAAPCPPRTVVEEVLLAAFGEALGVATVGIDDNFFDLGGDSIRSIRVRALARRAGVDVSVTDLFRHQTVRRLGRAAERVAREEVDTLVEPFALVSAGDRHALGALGADVVDAYPMSKLVEGFVFHSELGGDYAVYVMSFHVRAAFDEARLCAAAETAMRRHPLLRASFDWARFGEPLTLVHRSAPVELAIDDWRALSGTEQEERLAAWLADQTHARFDWSRPPLWRLSVQLRSDDRFQLTVVHPFLDGWSKAVLVAELALAGLGARDLASEPGPASSYADFVRLERRALASEEARAFWLGRLGSLGVRTVPRISAVDPSPTAVESVPVPMAGELATELGAIARAAGVPLRAVLLAAHAKVVATLGAGTRATVGMLFNGRPELIDGDRVLGQFTNALPLTVGMEDGSWLDLSRRALEAELEVMPHRRFPMAELYRTGGRAALFDTLFNFTHFHVYDELARSGTADVLSAWANDQNYVPLVVRANLNTQSGALELWLDRRATHLSRRDAERFAGAWRRALEAMARAPEESHRASSLIDESERRAVRAAATGPASAVDRGCLYERVAEEARRSPAAIAVSAGMGALDYRELWGRSLGLALRLRALGAGRGARVGVHVGRDLHLPVALLGVLASGAAYVPMDPEFPEERLGWMARDAGVRIVVSDAPLPRGLGELERLDPREPAPAPQAPLPDVDAADLAYVIYTSGSTGRPKGVAVSHGALAAFASAMRAAPGIGAGDVVAAVTTLSFDIAALELLVPLTVGARVEIVPAEVARDGERLGELIARAGATLMQATPSGWRLLVESGWRGQRLRALSGGEALSASLARELGPRVAALFNMYGPTETTVWSLFDPIDGDEVTIGRPIAGTTAHVLDAALDDVPFGTEAELYLGGAGLAQGYHGRPDLTAERFVPDPFGAPGSRLYRTGDRVRRRADGRIEFLGRADQQVKLRGYRIELGEIEAVLGEHPAVREAAAIVWPEADADGRLAAYAAAEARPGLEAELLAALRARLPAYMVPRSVVLLSELPRTANRKIDRRALPPPDRAAAGASPPGSPIAELVAELWREVLGIREIAAGDDFFELGGHSLLATQVAARLRATLGVELPVRTLFERSVLGDLVAAVEEARGTRAPLEPIPRLAREGPLSLSLGQQRIWFLSEIDASSALYNMPAALRLRGALDPGALGESLRSLMLRHEVLRMRYPAVDGEATVEVDEAPRDVLARLDLSELAEAEQRTALAEALGREASAPFDLRAGPVVRALLVRLGDLDHVLALNLHHIAGDYWSLALLERELVALYRERTGGARADLAPLPLGYADWAAWQRARLAEPWVAGELDWWRQKLAGAPAEIRLPLDFPRPARPSDRGARVPVRLAADLGGALRTLCRNAGATRFMVLLAGLCALLERVSGEDEIVVGTPIAGRERAEVEGIVGFFLNTLALRVDVRGDPSFAELVARVRETALEAYAHAEVPFERVVEIASPTRTLSRMPLFQVMLVMQQAAGPGARELPGLGLESLDVEPGTTRFDLTLVLGADGAGFFEYRTDLFRRDTVVRLAQELERLCARALADPTLPLSRLSLPDADELGRIAVLGRGAAATPAPSVHAMFLRAAAAAPEATALEMAGRTMSYAALERRSRALARLLVEKGVGRGAIVAVSAERSFEAVIGVLGVLRAGAAYLPLDASSPPARRSWMLRDARAALVLCADDEPVPAELEAVRIDEVGEETDGAPPPDLPEVGLDELAYAVYTSGSTGPPKAAMVPHGALANVVTELGALYGMRPDDRVLQFVSLAFDVAASEIFVALAAGATLVLAPRERLLPGPGLVKLLAEERITTLSLPASVLAVLEPAPLSALRTLVVGGEHCPDAVVRAWHAGRRMLNCYGPTETAICATASACDDEGRFAGIGTPLGGVRCFVLGRHGEPAPIGVVGELAIGGVAVGWGYAGRPDLTAAGFVPDPFAAEPGARLYRTGDRARLRADGSFEVCGRLDAQIKVRGHRIEPAEIERELAAHPAVANAAVTACDDRATGRKLCAYFLPRGAAPPASELRAFLGARLPDWAIPAVFVPLPSLPRTASGKLDRKHLPVPAEERAAGAERVAPRTPLEERLSEAWGRALGVRAPGMTDDFFDLGGNSFLVLKLLGEVERTTGVALPVASVFESGTVERMARLVEERSVWDEARALVSMRAGSGGLPLFFVHPVGGNVLCYAHLVRLLDARHPALGLQARGVEDSAPPRGDIVEMARAYVAEIARAHPRGPLVLLGWSFGGTVAYEMACQLRESGREVPLCVLLDSTAPVAQDREIDPATLLFTVMRDLGGVLGPLPRPEALRALDRRALEDLAVERVRQARLFTPGEERRALGRLLGAYRTHMNAHLSYHPRPFAGKLTYFLAGDSARKMDILARWRALARGGLDLVHLSASTHGNLLVRPQVVEVAAELAPRLARVG
jgi:amino acid adenylation domain-containing protein